MVFGVAHAAHIAWWGGGQGEGDGRCSVAVAVRQPSVHHHVKAVASVNLERCALALWHHHAWLGSGLCKPGEGYTDPVVVVTNQLHFFSPFH